GLRLVGLATNLGSQICRPEVFERAVDELRDIGLELRRRGLAINIINLGGGVPVRGLSRCFERPITLLSKAITGRSRALCYEGPSADCEPHRLIPRLVRRLQGTGFDLWMEPGRWLVADCMTLIATVVRVTKRGGRLWLYVNGGIDQLPDAGFGERRATGAAGAALEPGECEYAVGGPLCMKGDVFTRSLRLPAGLSSGDFIGFGLAGAYGFSRASWFGGHLPSIVEIDRSGRKITVLWESPDILALACQSSEALVRG